MCLQTEYWPVKTMVNVISPALPDITKSMAGVSRIATIVQPAAPTDVPVNPDTFRPVPIIYGKTVLHVVVIPARVPLNAVIV